jgi:hypothetical protein
MSLSRLTLPENFYDVTSAKLLAQPEPQYPLASLYLSAVGASLSIPSGFGLDGRQVPSSGSAYPAANKDALKLAEALPTSLFALGIDFAKTPGNTVRINRPAFADTTYTLASRKVATGQTISTTPITVGSEQTHLVLERFAGPYSTAATAVAPYAIEAFDANMGIHSAPSMIGTHLARDFHKFLDAVHVTLGGSGTAVYPDGMSAVDDATTDGSFPMTVEQLSRTEQSMDESSLPRLADGKRVLMVTAKQWKQLKHDPEYAANSSFHSEFNILFNSYKSTVGGFHVFVSETLDKTANSSSVAVHRGIAMAPGCFLGGMGRPPRVASSTDDNYAETAKVIWLADLAFGLADSRFFRSVRSA